MLKKIMGAAAIVGAMAVPASAALNVGAKAPDFSTQATIGGIPFTFRLADARKRGPVVLYFYPKAFTQGCTLEAREFAEASDDFAKLGATVIGMSNDRIETLNRFSVEECRSKFAVGVAGPALIKAYNVKLPAVAMSNRTSFVIAPSGKILYVHSAMSHKDHVKNTLAAVRQWRAART